MKSLPETLDYILTTASAVQDTLKVGITDALGGFLAEDIVSPIAVPPANNSAMDGYALAFNDKTAHSGYSINQVIHAGHTGSTLGPNEAARIFTGAEIPAGADTVAMQENCELSADGQTVIVRDTKLGDNIRHAGQDIAHGAELFTRGHRLTAVDIGLLASIGTASVSIVRPLKVAIMSTGDELTEPGEPLAPGKIYNSNRYLLTATLQSFNCEVVDLGRVEDTLEATEQALLRGVGCDLIISTGGVSVGDADFVKTAIANLGKLESWKVAIKPGKPLAFGQVKNTPFLGLPGNPVAVFVTFMLVVKPFLNSLRGGRLEQTPRLFPAGFNSDNRSDRTQYLRVRIDDHGRVCRFGNQSSGVLSSLSWADGLAIIEKHATAREGQLIPVLLLNDHLLK